MIGRFDLIFGGLGPRDHRLFFDFKSAQSFLPTRRIEL